MITALCATPDYTLFSSRFFSTHPHLYLDPRAEPVKNCHKTVQGEPCEIRIAYSGEVGCGDAGTGMRGAHGEAFPVERLDDFGRENGFELLCIGVLVAEVAVHIAAAAHDIQLFVAFHFSISFSFFSRSFITSISCFGVLMPLVDFFWKA